MNDLRDAGTAPFDESDAALLRDLREVMDRLDPTPAGLAERVKFALTMKGLQAEVAELTREEMALTRSEEDEPDQTATMTFSTDTVSIMVTVTEEDVDLARIDGWLNCEQADVALVRPGHPEKRVSVAQGRFVLTGVPSGSARLIVYPLDERTVVTPTFSL